MADNPKQEIREIVVFDRGERQHIDYQLYRVGDAGVTRIEATTKAGMHGDIPYVRVWDGDVALCEFCQHQILGVYFAEPASKAA